MKILVVADVSAEKVIGGAERMLVCHLDALRRAGYEVAVLSRQPRPDAAMVIELAGGVPEYRLPYSGDRGLFGLRELLRGARAWWSGHVDAFDVVIAEQPFVMWALRHAGCRLPRLQVCHSLAFEEYATRHGLDWNLQHRFVTAAMRRLETGVYTSAERLLVLSEHMRRRLLACFQLHPERIAVVPAGVEPPSLLPDAEIQRLRRSLGWSGPVVVTLRNLVPRTGVDMLVQAAAILRHDCPDVRWCVMGAGPLLEPLRWLAAQLHVEEIVEFTGYLPEEEVHLRMQAADAFMLPTRSLEGFGLVTIEAGANGLPVVATPVGANAEVVPRLPYNRLAEVISPEALAMACRELLVEAKPQKRKEIRNALRRAVSENFSKRAHDNGFLLQLQALAA